MENQEIEPSTIRRICQYAFSWLSLMYLASKKLDMEDNSLSFDPSGVGVQNGRFIGLPYTEQEARVVLQPVPWDVTVSFGEGTAGGPQNMLDVSSQLDLEDPRVPDAWKIGLFMRQPDAELAALSAALRADAKACISALEAGHNPAEDESLTGKIQQVNRGGEYQKEWVRTRTAALMEKGKLVGLVGGDHSCPLGFLEALTARHSSFGILQIDAHMDLRKAYEGFTYSHASIFRNALAYPEIAKLVQVGIRDYCREELDFAASQGDRIEVFFDHDLQESRFVGETWHGICQTIIAGLPKEVYLSVDIDGLNPSLCPNTGTPVPGGLTFDEALHLGETIIQSGRIIIGFDLCEVAGAPHYWDGNVGARMLYRLSNLLASSQGLA